MLRLSRERAPTAARQALQLPHVYARRSARRSAARLRDLSERCGRRRVSHWLSVAWRGVVRTTEPSEDAAFACGSRETRPCFCYGLLGAGTAHATRGSQNALIRSRTTRSHAQGAVRGNSHAQRSGQAPGQRAAQTPAGQDASRAASTPWPPPPSPPRSSNEDLMRT